MRMPRAADLAAPQLRGAQGAAQLNLNVAKDEEVRRAALNELQKRANQLATYTGEHADKVAVVKFGMGMAPASGVVMVKPDNPEESQD